MRLPASVPAFARRGPASTVSVYRSGQRAGALRLISESINELLTHIPLIGYLVGAELKRTHSDTFMGRLWWIIDPLVMMGIYLVLFEIIRAPTQPDFPLFLFAAILPYKWFSASLAESAVSVRTRTALLKQIQFPKIVLPTAALAGATVTFLFGLLTLVPIAIPFVDRIRWTVLLIVPIAIVQLLFMYSLALVISAANAFYADVQNLLRHALRILLYMSPVLWSLSSLREGSLERRILSLNPLAQIFEAYRSALWGTAEAGHGVVPDMVALGLVGLVSLVLIAIAMVIFKRLEPSFARVLA